MSDAVKVKDPNRGERKRHRHHALMWARFFVAGLDNPCTVTVTSEEFVNDPDYYSLNRTMIEGAALTADRMLEKYKERWG